MSGSLCFYGDILDMENRALEEKKVAGQLTKDAEYIWLRAIERLKDYKETQIRWTL